MRDTDAKETVRAGIEGYLQGKGIDTRKAFRCLRPEHEDRNPSMRYDPRRRKVHCFSCDADYDMFDLIGIEFGLDNTRDIFRKAYEYFGIEVDEGGRPARAAALPAKITQTTQTTPATDFAAYLTRAAAALEESEAAQAYLASRGIGMETARRFSLGYDPAWRSPTALRQGKNPPASARLIIPTGTANYVARAIGKDVEPRYAKMKEGSARPLNLAALSGTRPVFVVEGEMDALSMAEVGQEAVSLGSVSSAGAFLALLDAERPKAMLLLCLDDDDAGRRAQAKLRDGLAARGLPYAEADILGGAGDPNEALVQDREALRDAAARATRTDNTALSLYMRSSASYHLPAFLDGIARGVDTPAIPTGFPQLDALLDGGLYEGLYILGAISSLGKTTFSLQIAEQIAASGQDVLIFSLEMARNELIAKSISRQTLRVCLREGLSPRLAKTARGITSSKRYAAYNEEERGVVRRAIAAYDECAEHLFIHEGIGDIGAAEIRQIVTQHVALLERKPVVLIDYLQILAPYSDRATDKQNTDKAVLELKRISRDFKVPVIGISSFNRAGYATRVQMESFKESGAIEYSSDVLMGLQCKGAGDPSFDVADAKIKDPREIELLVLKNRNGRIGGPLELTYYPLFNHFEEAQPTVWTKA